MRNTVVGLYGLLNLFGGVMGYVKAGSMPSLVMGALFGFLLLGSSWMMGRGSKEAFFAALGLTIVLAAFFLWRFVTTGSLFPAALMAMISLLVLIVLLRRGQ